MNKRIVIFKKKKVFFLPVNSITVNEDILSYVLILPFIQDTVRDKL